MLNNFNFSLLAIIFLLLFIINFKKYNKKLFIFNYYKKKNFLFKIIKELLPILIFIFIFRFFLYEPFKIPSTSMMPNLLIGDYILVEKFSYNIRNPLTNNIIFYTKKPCYGDIIVFQYPHNNKINYIKRIIGLPGDKVTYNYKKKEIKIYNADKKMNKIYYIKKKNSRFIEEIKYKKNKFTERFWHYKCFKNKIPINFIKLSEKLEIINNIKYPILIIPQVNTKKSNYIKEWIVPKNMYFVMGDYRDNSEDSRHWGFLSKKLLIGKAKYLILNLNKKIYYINFKFKKLKKIC